MATWHPPIPHGNSPLPHEPVQTCLTWGSPFVDRPTDWLTDRHDWKHYLPTNYVCEWYTFCQLWIWLHIRNLPCPQQLAADELVGLSTNLQLSKGHAQVHSVHLSRSLGRYNRFCQCGFSVLAGCSLLAGCCCWFHSLQHFLYMKNIAFLWWMWNLRKYQQQHNYFQLVELIDIISRDYKVSNSYICNN